jgi:hypothetical protein
MFPQELLMDVYTLFLFAAAGLLMLATYNVVGSLRR